MVRTPLSDTIRQRLFDVKYNVLDIKKAQDYLNYFPIPNETEKIKQYLKKRYLGD